MQALFQLDIQGDGFRSELSSFLSDSEADEGIRRYAYYLTDGAWTRRADIDDRIRRCAEHWSLDRLTPVDRSVLRMGVFELIDPAGPSPAVVIDEAIELAKEFGDLESPGFVNGVLDAVRKDLGIGRAEADSGQA